MFVQEAVAVFTTAERCDLFRSAVGENADYRLNPFGSVPLDLELENLKVGGGSVAVLDETHFFSIEHMADGLRDYLNKPSNKGKLLRIVLVCNRRMAGDKWLDFFASYLGIYDIVYDMDSMDIVNAVSSLLANPNERIDVLPLFIDHVDRQDTGMWQDAAEHSGNDESQQVQGNAIHIDGAHGKVQVTVVVS